MHELLEHTIQRLSQETGLTSLVSPANIAASCRNPAEQPSIEVAITSQTRDPKGHQVTVLELVIHSNRGADECWRIIKALSPVMTASNLSDPASGFKVSRCRQTDSFREPRSEWSFSQVVEFTLHVAEMNPVHQNQ